VVQGKGKKKMKKLITIIVFMIFTILLGCTQEVYLKTNLNKISLGQTKEQVLSNFPSRKDGLRGVIPGMEIRAAQHSANGKLLEFGEVLLSDGVKPTDSYWFIFEDGLLVQWGLPKDWKKASSEFVNPSPNLKLN
jgi:hypothetical protein